MLSITFHSIPLNSTDFYFSLKKQSLGLVITCHSGWWRPFPICAAGKQLLTGLSVGNGSLWDWHRFTMLPTVSTHLCVTTIHKCQYPTRHQSNELNLCHSAELLPSSDKWESAINCRLITKWLKLYDCSKNDSSEYFLICHPSFEG